MIIYTFLLDIINALMLLSDKWNEELVVFSVSKLFTNQRSINQSDVRFTYFKNTQVENFSPVFLPTSKYRKNLGEQVPPNQYHD